MPDEPNHRSLSNPTSSSGSSDADANSAGADSTVGPLVEATLPGAAGESQVGRAPRRHPDPTRYGDWEKGGRCIDF